MDDFTYPKLPDLVQRAYCCKCGKVSEITWMVEQDRKPGLPYCAVCKALNWEAMAHLNRRRGCYCQNRRDW